MLVLPRPGVGHAWASVLASGRQWSSASGLRPSWPWAFPPGFWPWFVSGLRVLRLGGLPASQRWLEETMQHVANIKPVSETKHPGAPAPTFNPRGQLALGKKAADALIEVVKKAGLARNLGGKEYLFYEAWLTLARFFQLTPKVEWTRPFRLEEGGKIVGWEARAVVVDAEGREIAAAEAFCGRDEKNWEKRPHYAWRA